MTSNDSGGADTPELAARFLRVLESMGKLARYRPPADVAESLHLNQLRALHLIHRRPGLSQKELAQLLHVSPAAVSTAVRKMEDLDLVERRPDPDDTRLLQLHLSARGREIFDEMQAKRQDAVADLLSALPLAEQRTVVIVLERAVSARKERASTSTEDH